MFGEERLGLWSVREFCGAGILVPQRDSDGRVASPPKPRPSRWWALGIEEEDDVGSHVSAGANPTLGDMPYLIQSCVRSAGRVPFHHLAWPWSRRSSSDVGSQLKPKRSAVAEARPTSRLMPSLTTYR
ncbi:hypothetical protein OPV22_004224 [Ensete ventricosum]|uniref:Uncharacterized protein n=1 Tax=Ensete ventricosum TaxID=4639 RepID=A0AAV8S350_ENSVE|nr:hypothetical protein OPV22_004224 [Ensete ventricosum]